MKRFYNTETGEILIFDENSEEYQKFEALRNKEYGKWLEIFYAMEF